ncbi:MAG: DSBA oxidoreductase [Herpetosiphonaceae bacterium]|nr:MAG: DSBA oxidoreductase [Herpetosiphonaceae bacterium]
MARAYQRYGKRRRQSPLALLKIPLFTLGVLGICAVFYVLIANPPERRQAVPATATPVALTETDPILGDPSAPVRFFLYCDLAGPECAKFHQEIEPKLREEFIDQGKVAIVFRNTPQNRLPAALPAAHAVMCANAQGKFWEMYAHLLENQRDWRRLNAQRQQEELSAVEQKFVEYATSLGLDTASFETCLQQKEFEEAIKEDIADARQANANGVYAFRINQRRAFAGFRNYDFVRDVIQEELK